MVPPNLYVSFEPTITFLVLLEIIIVQLQTQLSTYNTVNT